jgi:hypothetical protein
MKNSIGRQEYPEELLKKWLGASRANAMKEVLPGLPLWKAAVWNQAVSASLLEDLSHIELALRNLLDQELTKQHLQAGRSGTWLSNASSLIWLKGSDDLVRRIQAAAGQVNSKRGYTHEHHLAELPLGFWTSLLGKRNLALNINLRNAFQSSRGRDLRVFGDRLARLNTLRNRLAHHHRILHRDLAKDFELLLSIANSLDPELSSYVVSSSRSIRLIQEISQLKR